MTTVTVRREAHMTARDDRPWRQPWNLHDGGMAAGVSPWNDQDRATSVWQRTSKKGKKAYAETARSEGLDRRQPWRGRGSLSFLVNY